jgi:ABC-type branched-subunit amino acid transport system substrate-binding protein
MSWTMANQYARTSLISLCAAVLIAAIHHVLELGARGAVIALILIPAAYGVMFWFKRSRSRAALIVYALLNVWMVVGFGLLHGFVEHTIKLFALSHSTATSDLTTLMRHLSGVAMAGAVVWVMITGWRFLSAAANAPAETAATMKQLPPIPAIASAALLVAVVGAEAYVDAQSFRVAIIAPITGPNAVLAQSFVRAAEMAKEDLGPEAKRIVLVTVDTTGTPEKARSVIDGTFGARRIDAVLGAVSASGQFTVPYAREARIPHICICSVRTIGDGQYNFTNIPLPEDEAVRWVTEAKRRGITTVAILAQEEESIRNHANAMAREAMRNGIKILFDGRFAGEKSDFALLAEQARAANADLVFAEAFPPLIDHLVNELRRQGVANIASIVTPSAADDLRAFEGIWYTDTNLADATFQSRFEARFPGTRFAAHMTPYAYDSFKLLARALASGADPAAYVRGVTRYDGVAGIVTRDRGGGNFRSQPAVWIIENGQPRELQP